MSSYDPPGTYEPSGAYNPPRYEDYPPPQRPGSGLAITALVLGIIGLLGSWFVLGAGLGIIAIIVGAIALARIKGGRASGRGMAITGIVLGVISVLVAAAVVALTVSVFNSPQGQNLQQCWEQVENDEAAIQRCLEQLQPAPAQIED